MMITKQCLIWWSWGKCFFSQLKDYGVFAEPVLFVSSCFIMVHPNEWLMMPWLIQLLFLSLEDLQYYSVQVFNLMVLAIMGIIYVVLTLGCLMDFYSIMMVGQQLFVAIVVLAGLMVLKIGFGFLYQKTVIGGADIWVIVSMVLVLGYDQALHAVMMGIGCATVIGVGMIVFGNMSRHSVIPMIPFLMGGVVILFFL